MIPKHAAQDSPLNATPISWSDGPSPELRSPALLLPLPAARLHPLLQPTMFALARPYPRFCPCLCPCLNSCSCTWLWTSPFPWLYPRPAPDIGFTLAPVPVPTPDSTPEPTSAPVLDHSTVSVPSLTPAPPPGLGPVPASGLGPWPWSCPRPGLNPISVPTFILDPAQGQRKGKGQAKEWRQDTCQLLCQCHGRV